MRKALVVLLGVCLLALFVGSVSARDIDRSGKRAIRDVTENENPALIDQGLQTLMATAAADTYCIVWFDFEAMDWIRENVPEDAKFMVNTTDFRPW